MFTIKPAMSESFKSSKLKELRRKRGLTQEQLAELVGVTRVAIAKWESGERQPKGEYLIKLSKVLGVHPSYFFESESNESIAIGQKIEKLRKKKGLSRRELAERIIEKFGGASVVGLSQYIYQLEKGKRKPKVETLEKIASVLGVPPSYFFESEESSSGELQYLGELDGFIELPVMGKVGAGDMIIPYPEGETYLVPLAGKRKPKPDWCVLKVEGKSMEPYIHDGSILVVEPAHFGYAEDGQIVVLCEEGVDWTNGCTVKKVKDLGDKWLIIPLNEEYEAYAKDKKEVKIKGIVRKVIWEP